MAMLKDLVNSCVKTTTVNGLSQQIIAEMNNVVPGVLVDCSDLNISIDSGQFAFLQQPAKNALARAIRARGTRMKINSAYRTCAQQFLLRRRQELGICGIGAAAVPGKSFHESGLALDIPDISGWKPFLVAQGWVHVGQNLPSDPFHFEFRGRGIQIIGNVGLMAFQKLWNKNHLNDRIGEDGLYGTNTASKLSISPSQGFGITEPNTQRILRLASPLMQGGDVKRLQMKLRQLTPPLLDSDDEIDGFYGEKTEAAVRKFQENKGLEVDGVVGTETYKALDID